MTLCIHYFSFKLYNSCFHMSYDSHKMGPSLRGGFLWVLSHPPWKFLRLKNDFLTSHKLLRKHFYSSWMLSAIYLQEKDSIHTAEAFSTVLSSLQQREECDIIEYFILAFSLCNLQIAHTRISGVHRNIDVVWTETYVTLPLVRGHCRIVWKSYKFSKRLFGMKVPHDLFVSL